jgi:hypothetical protein
MRPKDGVDTFVTQELAQAYGLELINLAMGGRGNNRISFTTKVWFEQNGAEDTFAVIGWSSLHRNDYITNDGWKAGRVKGSELTWRTWKTLDNVSFIRGNTGWDIENNAIMNFLDNVFDLQNYFERKKIPYVMYNALPNDFNSDIADFNIIRDSINMKRFFDAKISHLEFVMENNLYVSPLDPHPSTEGHKQWAKLLKEFIDANDLRTI